MKPPDQPLWESVALGTGSGRAQCHISPTNHIEPWKGHLPPRPSPSISPRSPAPPVPMDIRNIAIIAHVDHGKTTLVDHMLRQSGSVREHQQMAERALDSGDLERERGITILAKCTSVDWGETRINIVDTPGHADFGGEVERILSMVDGVVLLVDAAESVMPQTKFVLSKALKLGLKPIVVINKIDRSDAQPNETLESIFDLFLALEANDDQLDFHVLYASGRQGWAVADLADDRKDLSPLFARIVADVPKPRPLARAGDEFPFTMLVTTLEADPYLGRVLTGRIESGAITVNRVIHALSRGGEKVQSRVIRARLLREAEGNVAIHVRETGEGAYEVAGRGELQLGVLIETMRREGGVVAISRPRVLYQKDGTTGERLEPLEEVTIDVDDPYTGIVI